MDLKQHPSTATARVTPRPPLTFKAADVKVVSQRVLDTQNRLSKALER